MKGRDTLTNKSVYVIRLLCGHQFTRQQRYGLTGGDYYQCITCNRARIIRDIRRFNKDAGIRVRPPGQGSLDELEPEPPF